MLLRPKTVTAISIIALLSQGIQLYAMEPEQALEESTTPSRTAPLVNADEAQFTQTVQTHRISLMNAAKYGASLAQIEQAKTSLRQIAGHSDPRVFQECKAAICDFTSKIESPEILAECLSALQPLWEQDGFDDVIVGLYTNLYSCLNIYRSLFEKDHPQLNIILVNLLKSHKSTRIKILNTSIHKYFQPNDIKFGQFCEIYENLPSTPSLEEEKKLFATKIFEHELGTECCVRCMKYVVSDQHPLHHAFLAQMGTHGAKVFKIIPYGDKDLKYRFLSKLCLSLSTEDLKTFVHEANIVQKFNNRFDKEFTSTLLNACPHRPELAPFILESISTGWLHVSNLKPEHVAQLRSLSTWNEILLLLISQLRETYVPSTLLRTIALPLVDPNSPEFNPGLFMNDEKLNALLDNGAPKLKVLALLSKDTRYRNVDKAMELWYQSVCMTSSEENTPQGLAHLTDIFSKIEALAEENPEEFKPIHRLALLNSFFEKIKNIQGYNGGSIPLATPVQETQEKIDRIQNRYVDMYMAHLGTIKPVPCTEPEDPLKLKITSSTFSSVNLLKFISENPPMIRTLTLNPRSFIETIAQSTFFTIGHDDLVQIGPYSKTSIKDATTIHEFMKQMTAVLILMPDPIKSEALGYLKEQCTNTALMRSQRLALFHTLQKNAPKELQFKNPEAIEFLRTLQRPN